MDDRFKEIYQLLFNNYQLSNELPADQGGLGMPPVSATIRAIINQVDIQLPKGRNLRADSKYLLLINFYSMIFMPLALGGRLDFPNLVEIIDSDIRVIAAEAAAGEPNGEVSGHVLLSVISKRWNDLKTTKFRIWGDE